MIARFTSAELRLLRERTPASDAFVHLNHASTSLPDRAVFEAERGFIEMERSLGTHRAIEHLGDDLSSVPGVVARLLGVQPYQVAFVDSASRGWALALSAVAPGRRLEVFVSRQEWAANLMNLTSHRRTARIVLPAPSDGRWVETVGAALERRDRACVPVVSLPIFSSYCGTKNDLRGVAERVRDADGWLFADASQAVGQCPVDVTELGADVLVFPARKWLRGPRGIAVMTVSERALDGFGMPAILDIHGTKLSPTNDGRDMVSHAPGASRFQAYEHHPALRLGLRAAVLQLQQAEPLRVQQRVMELALLLRGRIGMIEGVRLREDTESGLVCFCVEGVSHEQIVGGLWRAGVNAALLGARYAPLAFDAQDSLIRLSPHVVTSERELEQALVLIESEIARCRGVAL